MEGLTMTLVKRYDNYFPSLPSFFNNLFSRDLMDWSNLNYSSTNTTLPAVNVRETDNEFEIEVAAPGLKRDDFKVNLDNDMLTISSERKDEKIENGDTGYTRKEFSYQAFQRSFSIPENIVNGDLISAKYNEGILRVVLPKREEVKPKPAREIKIA
jgi:HSP20 family protein